VAGSVGEQRRCAWTETERAGLRPAPAEPDSR
jgi:hypothetical protein